jgi:hypothetical protein
MGNKKKIVKALQGGTLGVPFLRCKIIYFVNFLCVYMAKIMDGLIRKQYIYMYLKLMDYLN